MANRTILERRAQHLLTTMRMPGPPVDVHELAARLGLIVQEDDLGENCSGVLVRAVEGVVIGVNATHHRHRQRFTIAHELGHYLLHSGELYVDKGYWVNFRKEQSGSGTKTEEREANAFASALLMPAASVKRAFYEAPFDLGCDESQRLKALADQFEVSQQAFTYRLISLGLTQDH